MIKQVDLLVLVYVGGTACNWNGLTEPFADLEPQYPLMGDLNYITILE